MPAGSPNLFKTELGRNLNRVFPPQYGGFEIPQVLGGTVNLTHDFPGTQPHLITSIYDAIGAVDNVQILAAIVPPDGHIWIIEEMSVFCSDAVSREMKLAVRYPPLSFVVTVFRVSTGVAQLPFPIGRRLILPPGAVLDLTVPVLTAGASLRWTLAYFQVPAGQFVPKN